MLLDSLLTIHVFSVIVWIGFGLYELLLSHEIRKVRGTPAEIELIRITGRYGGLVAIATLFVAITGILMASLFGWGLFRELWLGIKQGIMLAILLDMAWLTPAFSRVGKQIRALSDTPGPGQLERCRTMLAKIHPHLVLMRLGAIVAVGLAIWRPE